MNNSTININFCACNNISNLSHFMVHQTAVMVTLGCQLEEMLLRVEWRFAVVVHGALSVMTFGIELTLKLCAIN